MKTKLTLLLALLLLIGWSCRKELGLNETDTQVPADFWAYHPKTIKGETASGSAEKRVTLLRGMADLKAMKETKAFEKYVTKLGRPEWDNSFEFPSLNEVSTLLVPVINDKKELVTAIVVMTYAGKYYKYHVVVRGKYPKAIGKNAGRKLLPEKGWERLFAALDKEFYDKGPSQGLVKKEDDKTAIKDWQFIGWICWHWCLNDGYGECIPGSEWGYECGDLYEWVWEEGVEEPNGSEGGGNSNGGIMTCSSCPYNGGGGVPPLPPPAIETYYLPGRIDPTIQDIQDYTECFGTTHSSSSSYQITVYVQEPDWGASSYGLINGVGHVSIGLTKDNITQVIGFYPAGAPFSVLSNQNVVGVLKDNGAGGMNYTVSAIYNLSAANFASVLTS